jgi:DNA polymerase III, epsilon subunit and related 3''-5'' exonucleases
VYKSGEVPEPLQTMTQLKAQRLKPAEGQEVKGLLRMYRRGYGWGVFDLYDPAGAVPMRPLSAKQEAAKTARRTCPECQEVRSYIVYVRCTECQEARAAAEQELRARTCRWCRRVGGSRLSEDVRRWPACGPCRVWKAIQFQAEQERRAEFERRCWGCPSRACTTVLYSDEQIAAAKADGTWNGLPHRCPACDAQWDIDMAEQARRAAEDARAAEEARRLEVERLAVWARAALADEDVVILDTETTGLEDDARIVEISILGIDGTVLLDTLVNPGEPIGEATDIHGITDAMVADAPSFTEVLPRLTEALAGRRCLIYNASYDVGRLRHELTLHHQAAGHADPAAAAKEWLAEVRREDAMERYSNWCGEWSEYWGNYSWQPLDGGHRALGDCRAVIGCLQQMAAPEQERAEADPWQVAAGPSA